MQKLDDSGQAVLARITHPACARTEQNDQRPQAFSAGADNIVADLLYQRNAGMQLLKDKLVHRIKIIGYRCIEWQGGHRLQTS